MPINFHDEKNKMSYTTRTADECWLSVIKENIEVTGKEVVDIGCGGGIYTKALVSLGASQVTGLDFSEAMLSGAAENCKGIENVSFVHGSAYDTGLLDNQFDIILERALIHHLDDLDRCFLEANRILKTNGMLIIQDRTPSDCLLPGDDNHFRGYFFEKFPRLIEKEVSRRYDSNQVRQSLDSNGFTVLNEVQLWETRREYQNLDVLRSDLMQRTGRSILHELTEAELQELVAFIQSKLAHSSTPIVEKDSWTLWFAISN